MADTRPPYHEGLLHWIWEHQYYSIKELKTCAGEAVEIHAPGKPNKSDGPDFLRAAITIANLRWYGDVELHWKISDWESHGHTTDANYNSVVLHVVFDHTELQVQRADATSIPTLCLSDFLSESLQKFIEQYRTQPRLPCAGHLAMIPEEVFSRQLDKAHREYFEQKIDALMAFYDPALPPSEAWKKMLAVALFDGLGISHNRLPMQQLARCLWRGIESFPSSEELLSFALKTAEADPKKKESLSYGWKHKGVRPGNHPFHRIRQGVLCLWYIYRLPFEQWSRQNAPSLWRDMIQAVAVTPGIGKERSNILYGTVFLPSLYILGNLLYSEQLKSATWRLWQEHQVTLPSSLLKLLNNTPVSPKLYQNRLGTIFQLRNYCRPKHCQKCEVFKYIISS